MNPSKEAKYETLINGMSQVFFPVGQEASAGLAPRLMDISADEDIELNLKDICRELKNEMLECLHDTAKIAEEKNRNGKLSCFFHLYLTEYPVSEEIWIDYINDHIDSIQGTGKVLSQAVSLYTEVLIKGTPAEEKHMYDTVLENSVAIYSKAEKELEAMF